MIARMWRGRAVGANADAYAAVFQNEVLHELKRVAGFRGAYLLRRDDADATELVTLTLFDSLDAVRGFAGEVYDTAIVSPAARAVLRDYDRTVRHYTIVAAPDAASGGR